MVFQRLQRRFLVVKQNIKKCIKKRTDPKVLPNLKNLEGQSQIKLIKNIVPLNNQVQKERAEKLNRNFRKLNQKKQQIKLLFSQADMRIILMKTALNLIQCMPNNLQRQKNIKSIHKYDDSNILNISNKNFRLYFFDQI